MAQSEPQTLADWRRAGPLPETTAVRIVEVCAALAEERPVSAQGLQPTVIQMEDDLPSLKEGEGPADEADLQPALAELLAFLIDQGEASPVCRALIAAAGEGRYEGLGALRDDLCAALQGLPLVHALGGPGRLAGFEAVDDPRARLLLLSSAGGSATKDEVGALKPVVIIAALLLMALWFTWLVPQLRTGIRQWRPDWAVAAGHDRFGRWAEINLAEETLRFRLLQHGELPAPGDLWVLERELPRGVWRAVGPEVPDRLEDLSSPMYGISHADAVAFCQRLNALVPGFGCRLPSRAEWTWLSEQAPPDAPPAEAVAAGPSLLAKQEALQDDRAVLAWWQALPGDRRQELGPRPFLDHEDRRDGAGLADLVGNLAEWCGDADPLAPQKRVAAGGSWFDPPGRCTLALRRSLPAEASDPRIGLRPVIPFAAVALASQESP